MIDLILFCLCMGLVVIVLLLAPDVGATQGARLLAHRKVSAARVGVGKRPRDEVREL